MRRVLVGVLVGGESRRMGGSPKGLLRVSTGETILERWGGIFDRLGIERVLVGARPEYEVLGWRTLADDPAAHGPLAGLLSLLSEAGDRYAIAVACDMPYVGDDLVRRLLEAGDATVVAPRREDRWEPLFARYDAKRVLPIARAQAVEGRMALQRLLDRSGAVELPTDEEERRALGDWDSETDIDRT